MDINSVDSGGRVTRSLRKRLASIDSDNSSRPGTPLSTKLTSIAEASASPSKTTRSTRRNSVSGVATPVKTPSKRGVSSSVIPENQEASLQMRSTRRRSAFANEYYETRQANLQSTTSQSADKEIVQTDEQQTIITRSKSSSPQNSTESSSPKTKNITEDKSFSPKPVISTDGKQETDDSTKTPTSKKRKPGPKSKTGQHMDDMSDVEINVLEKMFLKQHDVKDTTSNNSFIFIDDDSINVSNMKDEEEHSTPCSPAMNVNVAQINKNVIHMNNEVGDMKPLSGICETSDTIPEVRKSSVLEDEFSKQIPHDRYENKEKEMVCEKNMLVSKRECEKYNVEDTGSLSNLEQLDINAESYKCKASDVKGLLTENIIEKDCITCDTIFNDCTTSEKRETPKKIENLPVNTSISHESKEAQKKVDFISTPRKDSSIKIVYPKTPVSTTYKNLRSSENDSSLQTETSLENEGIEVIEVKNIGMNCKEIDEISIQKHDLGAVESNKTEVVHEKAKIEEESSSQKDIDKLNIQDYSEEDLNWINPSVKRNIEEGLKLDVLTNDSYSSNNMKDINPQNQTDKQKCLFLSDGEVAEIQENEIDDSGEECERRKLYYIDDEAMEVENYKSGDSMDSEERMEIELNEISNVAESIGSQNTDSDVDEYGEEELGENSFIVSDNEIMLNSECDDNIDDEMDEYPSDAKQRRVKKLYKRIVCPKESSASSDEMEDQNLNNCRKDAQDTVYQKEQKEISNTAPEEENNCETNTSNNKCQKKTSESYCEQNASIKSCDKTNLDSSKLNDSALRLHYTSYSKSDDEDGGEELNNTRKEILSNLNRLQQLDKSVRHFNFEEDKSTNQSYALVGTEQNDKDDKNSSSEEIPEASESGAKDKEDKNSSSEGIPEASESDADKENEYKSSNMSSERKSGSSLGISFQNSKNPKKKIGCQTSYTIDITVKNGELESKIADVKTKANDLCNLSLTYSQKSEEREIDLEGIENIRHTPLPLGNPLIRTRRQSLALPTNPDMEICSSAYGEVNKTKVHRKSFCAMSNIDLKPSQSFIESIEFLKKDKNKRKQLSKSFGGSTEAHYHNIANINVTNLHNMSKIIDKSSIEEGDQESVEQRDSSKIFAQVSSTPHERNDSYSTRILTRCDEILEAANRAKLEAKLKNKKMKTKVPKKLRKKPKCTSSEEITPDDKVLRNVPTEIKRKDKKTVILQALTAANDILNKQKMSILSKPRSAEENFTTDVIETNRKADSIKKKRGKGTNQQKNKIGKVFATSAGNFMVFPQTPEKKKVTKYFQLSTGKVSVEPVSPKKACVKAFNGNLFRESPLSPCTSGFIMEKMNLPENRTRTGKRKRHEQSFKNIARPNAQWTQSGLFTEEVILDECAVSKKTKRIQENVKCNVQQNFKEIALTRPDVNRSTKRELFLVKERMQTCATKKRYNL